MFSQLRMHDADCSPDVLRRGLTLAELVVVLAILTILGGLLVPMVGHYLADSRADVTRQSLCRLRDVIAETYWQDAGRKLPQPDMTVSPGRQNHAQLRYLFVNPLTEDAVVQYDPAIRHGWRGPYLVVRQGAAYTVNNTTGFTNLYGENGDPAAWDGWGRPIVLQNPGPLPDGRQDVRLVSAGPDGVLNIPSNKFTSTLTAADIGDDVWVSFEVR